MMEASSLDAAAFLAGVRARTESDFAGVALMDEAVNGYVWKHVSGNRNERYKRMVKRASQGIVGLTLRHGRPVRIDSTEAQAIQSPILLAEQLHAAVTAPIVQNGRIIGVLLVGRRDARSPYNEESLAAVSMLAELFPTLAVLYE